MAFGTAGMGMGRILISGIFRLHHFMAGRTAESNGFGKVIGAVAADAADHQKEKSNGYDDDKIKKML